MEQRKLKPLKEKEARKIMIQLFKAVQYSHSRNVVHLDIKLDNIMIEPKSGHVTLIDFGLCDFITEQNSGFIKRRVGSKEYCAAELLTSQSESYDATKVDVWCLGVVLYTLISSKFPFNPKVSLFEKSSNELTNFYRKERNHFKKENHILLLSFNSKYQKKLRIFWKRCCVPIPLIESL